MQQQKHSSNYNITAVSLSAANKVEVLFSNEADGGRYQAFPFLFSPETPLQEELALDFNAYLAYSILQQQPVTFRHITVAGNNRVIWLTQVVPMRYNDKTIALCISENITSFEAIDEGAVKNKLLLDRLYEVFPAAIIITDEQGNITECNLAAQNIFGYSRSALQQMNIKQLPHDLRLCDAAEKPLAQIENPAVRCLNSGRAVENELIGARTGASGIMWLNISCAPLQLPGYGVVVTCRNITNRQKQAQQLLQSKRLLQAVINSSSDCIFFLDLNYKVAWYNNEAGKKIRSVLGNNIDTIAYADYILNDDPKEKLMTYVARAMEKKVYGFEHEIISHDGRKLWYHRRYHAAYDEQGDYIGCIIISTDITERKNKELFISAQNEKLREIARIQSHELRRPLANVLGLASILQDQAEKEIDRDLLRQLAKNAADLDDVIVQITSKTKPE